MSRRGTTGAIGDGRELALEVPEGLWLGFLQPVNESATAIAVAPEIRAVTAVPGGGYAAVTRQFSPVAGTALAIAGPGRVTIADPGAQSTYIVSIALVMHHPPRWGLQPQSVTLPPGQSLQIAPPPFSTRGQILLLAGSLAAPPLAAGVIEVPPTPVVLTAGQSGAELAIWWEGWF